jgi:hypothetical protein
VWENGHSTPRWHEKESVLGRSRCRLRRSGQGVRQSCDPPLRTAEDLFIAVAAVRAGTSRV